MKLFIKISLLLLPVFSIAQQNLYMELWNKEQIDSLRLIWHNTTNDTLRMAAARSLGMYYQERNRDSGLYFNEQQALLATQLKLRLWEGDALDNKGYVYSGLKDYGKSLQSFLDGIRILEDKEAEKNIWRISIFSKEGDPVIARLTALGYIHNDLGVLYMSTGNFQEAVSNLYQAIKIGDSINFPTLLSDAYGNLSDVYVNLNKLDSALSVGQKAIYYCDVSGMQKDKGNTLAIIGSIYQKKGNYLLAKQYYAESVKVGLQQNNLAALGRAYVGFSNIFRFMGERDSSLWYAKKGLEIIQSAGVPDLLVNIYSSLSSIYKLCNNVDSAFYYQGLALALTDSINSVEKIKQFQNIGFDQQLKVQELEKEKIENQNKVRTYGMLVGIAVFMLIAFLLYRNNRNRKKANDLLQRKNVEIEQQKKTVEGTLVELKSTQSQLIQSEKMASLGELTAGIAHEIQNPLNFVNNFSEVNKEMLEELKAERLRPKEERDEQTEAEIIEDVIANEEKIIHHGKRADAIVKGMLQHSRSSTGAKEPTDINKLADEYLRLSYHGLRAKDKEFNAIMKTDFDESIGKINIIPQDIGRVLLNLYNNAFYAVTEKAKQQPNRYEPTIYVTTKKLNNKITITVKDNGNGIPQKIIDKIFQPFFTTKPTGQGTGLGLSLSYDIIKAHGGEIKVNTIEGEFTEFVIQLPISV